MANDGEELHKRTEETSLTGVSNLDRAKRRWITVEPVASLSLFSYFFIGIIQPFYLKGRLGESLYNFTGKDDEYSTCAENGTDDETQAIEEDIQSQTSLWLLYLFMASSIPLLISSVILGTLSDRLGRKMCMVLPTVGFICQEVVYLATIYFKLPLQVLFLGAVLQGMTGGFGLFNAGCTSYIVDITSEKNLTFRLAVFQMLVLFLSGIVQVGVGFMVDYLGTIAPLLVALGANILCLVYIAIPGLLIETVDRDNIPQDRKGLKEAGRSVVKLIMFNKNRRRWHLLLLSSLYFFVLFNEFGTASIFILYGTATPFCWDAVSASIASAFGFIIVSVGTVGGTKLFGFCMGEYWIMQISCLSLLAYNVVMGLSKTTWMIYLANTLSAFEDISLPMARSVISRIVDSTETGAAFSLLACLDNLSAFIASTVGTGIYAATVQYLPPTIFYIFAGLCIIPAGIVVVLQLYWPRNKNDEPPEEKQEEHKESGHTNEGMDESVKL